MRAIDIIIKKRDGLELTEEEISFFIKEYVSSNIPDYQMASLLMAIFLKGMTFNEIAFLTRAMIDSGDKIDLSMIKELKVDKHSTGGVGDKISIILAPIVASCGVKVPMMSGRGLGHTGGTLDKLQSIKGYRVSFEYDEIIKILRECNYIMMGQTDKIVPADKRMYALRDVTGTVESIPLITSSIVSKKIAEGIDALVMDIKAGKGAFMKSLEQARELANSIIKTVDLLGKKAEVLITDMNQPLGRTIGNLLEVKECYEILSSKYDDNNPLTKDIMEITVRLAEKMLLLSGKVKDKKDAKVLIIDSINSGKALEYFKKNVELQGGDIQKIYNTGYRYKYELKAEREGYIEEIDAFNFGTAAMLLGAGRKKLDDIIDPYCGIEFFKKYNCKVKKNETIANIYYNNEENIESAINLCKCGIKISGTTLPEKSYIIEEL